MDFQTAIRTVLKDKYATFSGRAARSEYWWFALFSAIASSILTVIDTAIFGSDFGVLGPIFSLAVLVPSIAVGVRRLHDLGRSGWWLLIILIPLIGFLILLYFFVQKGTDGPNEHGPDPLAPIGV